MKSSIFYVTLLGATLVYAFPGVSRRTTFDQYAIFENTLQTPDGYIETNKLLDWNQRFLMRIDLRFQNMESFENHVLDISTPSHSLYGQFMTQVEIDNIVSPSQASIEAVASWLDSSTLSPNQYWLEKYTIRLNITLEQAQTLFKTNYKIYEDTIPGSAGSQQIIKSLEYSLPVVLHAHIALVQPTNRLSVRAMSDFSTSIQLKANEVPVAVNMEVTSVANMAARCDGPYRVPIGSKSPSLVTPDCLASFYKYAYYRPGNVNQSKLGIANFLGQFPQLLDTKKSIIVNNGSLVQWSKDSLPDIGRILEDNMDAQYGIFSSLPINQIWYTTGGSPDFYADEDVLINDNEPFLEWAASVANDPDPAQTISISYGEPEQTVPLLYANHVASLFTIMAAKGISIIVASGDSGPGWSCVTNDGKNTTTFEAMFPATLPFVTSVGATFGSTPRAEFLSSGGFSRYFSAPAWQENALSWYFGNNTADWQPLYDPSDPSKQYFNKAGRGSPDVALVGNNFDVLANGTHWSIGGTSASTPVFAGMIQRLNEQRHHAGRGRLGFLNPLLYSDQMTSTFSDVTTGTSHGCSGFTRNGTHTGHTIPGSPNGSRWSARKGWDPVTGLGSPNYL